MRVLEIAKVGSTCLNWGVFAAIPLVLLIDASADRVPVEFRLEYEVLSTNNAVFVTGNHIDLGDYDPSRSIKLTETTPNVWGATIGLEAGTTIEFSYLERSLSQGLFCNDSTTPKILNTKVVVVPGESASKNRTVHFASDWSQAFLSYQDGEVWNDVTLKKIDDGSVSSILDGNLFYASGIELDSEFFFHDGNGTENRPSAAVVGDFYYATPLKDFLVFGGQIYNYLPSEPTSPSRIDTFFATSTAPNTPSRDIHVYLPRGYEENTWKSYPVIYMHDGDGVFDPERGAVNIEMDRVVGLGQVQECIVVAITTSNRNREFFPPPDIEVRETDASGIDYRQFIVEDLMPEIEERYRSLQGPEHTSISGFSNGGVASNFLSWDSPDVFGSFAAKAAAYRAIPKYLAKMEEDERRAIRIYLQVGTINDFWESNWGVYDIFVAKGYVPNVDLKMFVGCGDNHSIISDRKRLRVSLPFLRPILEEANLLVSSVLGPDFVEIGNQEYPSAGFQLPESSPLEGTEMTYGVVSGPAQIVGKNEIRVTGGGQVSLAATLRNENGLLQVIELSFHSRLSDPFSDTDGDGYSDLLESALGGDLEMPGLEKPPRIELVGGWPHLRFHQARNDLSYLLVSSGDLQNWSDEVLLDSADSEKDVSIPLGDPFAKFFRLKVFRENDG